MFSNMFKMLMILAGGVIIFLTWINGLYIASEWIVFLYKVIGKRATIPAIISLIAMICVLIYSSKCTIYCIKYLFQKED